MIECVHEAGRNRICLLVEAARDFASQFTALFGIGEEPADLSIRPKERPLSATYLSTVLAALTL